MPIFFFHVHGDRARLDGEGRNFRDARAALHWALVEARRLLSEALRHGRGPINQWIEIADAQGVPIARVPFRDAAVGFARPSVKSVARI